MSLIALSSAAKYDGKGAADARRILNDSQGVKPYGYNMTISHPRGHAIGWDSGSYSINSVQDYSRSGNGSKIGFQSIWEQDEFVHRALSSKTCQDAMADLNTKKHFRATCVVSADEIEAYYLMVQEWNDGKSTKCDYMAQMTLELGHFLGKNTDARFDVHIHTAYPQF